MTDQLGVAELEYIPDWSQDLKRRFHLGTVKEPLFWFGRLKVKLDNEGTGEGKFLMQELLTILDQERYAVVCVVSPYGKRDMEGLVRFFENSGFVKLPGTKKVMVRLPM